MSHDLLDDLLADVPRQVMPDVAAAWRNGVRRRRRRQVVGVAAAIALAAVAGVGVLGFDPQPRIEPADGGSLTGYPAEIPRPIGLTELPEKAGPMAAVLIMDGPGEVAVVDSRGRSWLVPDVSAWADERPTLSEDGRMLGYLSEVSDQRSEFVIVDLVTGSRTTFPDVGDGRVINEERQTEQPYFTSGQAPGYWSPDNRWLVVNGSAHEDPQSGPLLLGVDGQVRQLGVGTWPVGWFGLDRIAVLTPRQLRTVDPDGRVLAEVTLAIPDGYQVFGQWSAALSSNRKSIAVRVDGEDHRVVVMDTRTGEAGAFLHFDKDAECQLTWPGNNAEKVLTWDPALGLVRAFSSQPVVILSSRWGELSCGTFAADALKGQPQPGPGVTEWRYWSWRKVAGGLVLIAFIGGTVLIERRASRPRREPA